MSETLAISSELRDFILAIAKRDDVHSVSCPFLDRELWTGLLLEQQRRASTQNISPKDALFLSGPDSGIPGIARLYPGIDEAPEHQRFNGSTLEEQLRGYIHIPWEGVCGADFFIYPAWRRLDPEEWGRENADLDWATPYKACNHLLVNGNYGEPTCANRVGPIDGWWLYSSKAPYKACYPFPRPVSA